MSRETEAAAKYQTESVFQKLETPAYLDEARTAYLAAAWKALPDLEQAGVAAVVDALHQRLREESEQLVRADMAHAGFRAAEDAVDRLLGDDPQAAFDALREARQRGMAESAEAGALLHKWEAWLATEPMMLSLFGFLPPVARRRVLRARLFLRGMDVPDALLAAQRIDSIEHALKEHGRAAAERAGKAVRNCDEPE
jgi:hypothetical protein